MFLDKQTLLSDKQDLAQVVGNYLSTNTIDLRATGTVPLGGTVVSDPGRGKVVELLAQVTEDFTSAGAATVQAQIVSADDAALGTNLTVLQETPAIAKATLVAGYQFRIGRGLPPISQRFLGVRYVIAGATTTAGKCTAGVILDRQSNPTV